MLSNPLLQPPKPLDVPGVSGGYLAVFACARSVHNSADSADNKADTTPRPCFVEGENVIVHAPAERCEIDPHRCHRDPVLDFQIANLHGTEQPVENLAHVIKTAFLEWDITISRYQTDLYQ
jgi:hypothetical protein